MNTNKHRTIKEKKVLVESFIASGKSVRTWCHENKISTSTFHGWLKKFNGVCHEEVNFIEINPISKKKITPKEASKKNLVECIRCSSSNAIVLELGKLKLNIPQGISMSHFHDVMKVVVNLDL